MPHKALSMLSSLANVTHLRGRSVWLWQHSTAPSTDVTTRVCRKVWQVSSVLCMRNHAGRAERLTFRSRNLPNKTVKKCPSTALCFVFVAETAWQDTIIVITEKLELHLGRAGRKCPFLPIPRWGRIIASQSKSLDCRGTTLLTAAAPPAWDAVV